MDSRHVTLMVAVCTRHREAEVLRLIDSVEPQLADGDRVVIIDNGDEPSARLQGLEVKSPFISVEWEAERGYSAVRNRALAELRDETALVFIDDDEVAAPGWLEAHRRHLATTDADAVFGPVVPLYPEDGDRRIARGDLYGRPRMATGSVRHSGGAGNTAVRSAWLRASGMTFAPEYNLTGGEDNDFFSRMHVMGARMEWNDDALAREPISVDRMTVDGARERFTRLGVARCRQLAASRGVVYLVARIIGLVAAGSVHALRDLPRRRITRFGARRIWSGLGGLRYLRQAWGDRADVPGRAEPAEVR